MRRAVAAALAILLGACTILDPNAHEPRLLEAAPSLREGADSLALTGAADLPHVFRALDAQQVRYMQAAAEIERMRSLGPVVAAGLGIAGAALAATGTGSTDLQFGLLAGAAGTVGASSYFADRARQEVYRNGADAIGCLASQHAPLRQLRPGAAGDLLRRIAERRAALVALLAVPSPNWRGGRWSAADIAALQARAGRVEARLVEIAAVEATAAHRLQLAARRIIVAVDREISRAMPDPLAGYRALGGGIAGLDRMLPLSVAPGGEPLRGEASNDDTLIALAATALLEAVQAADALALAVQPALPGIGAADCRMPEIPNGLRVFPDAPFQRLTALPAQLTFQVSGGIGNRRAILGGETSGFRLAEQVGTGGGLVVTLHAEAAAAGRQAEIAFVDDSGLPARRVLVSAAEATTGRGGRSGGNGGTGGGGGTRGSSAGGAPAPTMVTLTPHQVRMVIRALGQTPESNATVIPSSLHARLLERAVPATDIEAGRLDNRALAGLLDALKLRIEAAPPNTTEMDRATDNNLAIIHCLLTGSVPPAGALRNAAALASPAFRHRLLEFQASQAGSDTAANRRLEVTGMLDDTTAGRIITRGVNDRRCDIR